MTHRHRALIDHTASSSHRRRWALLRVGIAGIALLGGCTSHAPHPDSMARQSQTATTKGQNGRAIALAEQAVLADGRNPALRLVLANAYLRAGRFESARQTYADAIDLGDDSSRAAIGLVLCDLALGHTSAALDTINTYGDVLPAADLGLALVMAGQSDRGITVLTTAIRDGHSSPKVRQNLAYAYAQSGMWSEARIMVGQDLPADQVNARIQAWAAMMRPEDGRRRIASLIGSPLVNDGGRPDALALAHFPGASPDKAMAAATPPAAPATPAAQTVYPSGALARIDLDPATAHQPPQAPTFAHDPVVQPVPAAHGATSRPVLTHRVARLATAPRAARAGAAPGVRIGTHLVQLGAFSSAESAHRAWRHFSTRNPSLRGRPSLVTKVSVHGRDLWRLQAGGFVGRGAASSLCGTLRAHGGACLVMAVSAAARVNAVHLAVTHKAAHHGAPAMAQKAPPHPALPHPAPAHPAPAQPAAAHPAPAHPAKANPARK